MNNIVAIAAVEAETAAREAGGALEDRLRAAMRATSQHWMATQEDDQFNAAMQGCARTCDPDEVARLEEDIRRQNALAAMMSGVPVDFEALTVEGAPEPVGALKMWREIKDGA